MRNSVSTASACGSPSVCSETIAAAISERWSVASSTKSVRYFFRSNARSYCGLASAFPTTSSTWSGLNGFTR